MLPFVDLWNEWGIHILVLLSFALQVLLHLFGRIRRRNASFALRSVIWLVYMLADSTATYTVGRMGSSCQRLQHLVAFWAPFLLLHLGGQDTITAYALEDNELWLRHLLSLGVQAFGVTYLLYKYIAGARLLIPASLLVFVAGILKYGERVWALKCASTSNMQGSFIKLGGNISLASALCHVLQSRMVDSLTMYGSIVDAAHSALHFSKRLFVTPGIASEWHSPRDCLNRDVHDYSGTLARHGPSYYLGRSYTGPWIQAKVISKVIDLELSLMYDILYTKSAVIHTWYGYSIRAFSILAIGSAFMLFISGIRDTDYHRADVAVTYILLVGASLLEITSSFRAIGSTWAYAYLNEWRWYAWDGNSLGSEKWELLSRVVLSLRWHFRVRLGRWFCSIWKHKTDSSEGWPTTSIGQYNLISMSSRLVMDVKCWRLVRLIGLEDWWCEARYSRFIQASPAVVEVIYAEIQRRAELTKLEAKKFDDDIRFGRWTRSHDELERLSSGKVFRSGFIGFILVCHIATDIFVHCCNEEEELHLAEVAMTLSNHMMYLLRVHQDILPSTTQGTNLWNKDNYDETCNRILPELFGSVDRIRVRDRPQETLFIIDKCARDIIDRKYINSVFRSGCELAAKLGKETSLPHKLEFLTTLWVDTLLYVADGITAKFHAKQLSCGGEFVTFVSVLVAHFGLQKQVYAPHSPSGDDNQAP